MQLNTRVHCLKTWPEFFKAMKRGRKRFDIRRDDRGFKVGDRLVLEEWDPSTQSYTGEGLIFRVTYCLRKQPWVPKGYVAMSVEEAAG
ncbi:MAG: DUF3850 domain-containing protein [bacterium]|nr:DUF3850 domain-containing protein [bacterium]